MKHAIPAVLALVAAAGLVASTGLLRAADETPHDAVERLMPQLLSDDDVVRNDAESKLFALGEPGRAEMERMTRDADPRRAVTALRLLESKKWPKTGKSGGEQRVHRDGGEPQPRAVDPLARIDELQAQMDRQMEELRKRFEGMDHGLTWSTPGFDVQGGAFHGSSSGSVVENDKKTVWTLDADGRIKVTIQDGKDAPEQTFEAKSMDELKRDHPDVAKRIEPMLGRTGGRNFVLRLGTPGRELFGSDGKSRFLVETPQTPVLGVEWSPVPDVLREQLDLSAGGIVVESVVKDSLAEKLGLVRYDVLVQVQGKDVANSAEVRKALEDAKAGDPVKVLVVRKGQKKALDATK